MAKHPLFAMSKPCENCPFLKEGAIQLAPGRVEGITAHVLANDYALFHCHKTVHHITKGGAWTEEGEYVPSGKESACAGALIYCLKAARPPVALRFALMTGALQYGTLMAQRNLILDPPHHKEPQ